MIMGLIKRMLSLQFPVTILLTTLSLCRSAVGIIAGGSIGLLILLSLLGGYLLFRCMRRRKSSERPLIDLTSNLRVQSTAPQLEPPNPLPPIQLEPPPMMRSLNTSQSQARRATIRLSDLSCYLDKAPIPPPGLTPPLTTQATTSSLSPTMTMPRRSSALLNEKLKVVLPSTDEREDDQQASGLLQLLPVDNKNAPPSYEAVMTASRR